MIRAEFSVSEQGIRGFTLSGHAGLAPAGSDVLCAAVSAMALLVANTLKEVFGARFDLTEEEDTGFLSLSLTEVPVGKEEAVRGVLRGFLLQLTDLREQYPANLSITTTEMKGR
ncbi:MAG: ribosomal-processing cysteine protease Prp [Clostridia bacterium]|nr:ribosomal-processing cysteine protease Prp [Clostridia bacterium]